MSDRLQAAILVISQTASADPSTDESGPVLTEIFHQDGNEKWNIPQVKIVPDSIGQIQSSIFDWCDDDKEYMNLVVTTGGTGFATTDITPEALSPLIKKPASGLV